MTRPEEEGEKTYLNLKCQQDCLQEQSTVSYEKARVCSFNIQKYKHVIKL